jgi:phosphonate transport system substrate-binding protein
MMRLPLLAVFVLILAGCGQKTEDKPLQYSDMPAGKSAPIHRLAIPPLHTPENLSRLYQPLIDHLNQTLPGLQLELETARDFAHYEQKFRDRQPALLLLNPWQALQAMKVGYHVIAMAGDAEDFKGIFIVRKDGGIRQPADLKGKVVSYPSPTALAAAIMPQYFLHTHGIDVNSDIENRYVGAHESSIMNVYLRTSAVAATWPPPWRLFQKEHPAEAAQLKVAWETPPLMNNAVMVRDDLPAVLRDRLKQTLLELAQTPAGVAMLARMETARFHAANDASYERVRDYIARFEKEVRPVEKP